MNPFQSLHEYETYVYTLPQKFPCVAHAALTLIRRGKYRAELMGELFFVKELRLTVYEHLTCDADHVEIEGYSYEVWRGSEKLYWYDSQPHPNDPGLAATDPHHKHIPPDIKHHRIPAPELRFTQPNLLFLIRELEQDFL